MNKAEGSFWNIKGNIKFGENILYSGELEESIEYYCRYFMQFGITKSNIISLYMDRSPEALIIMFSLLRMGVPFLTLDINLPTARLIYMINNVQSDVIIMNPEYADVFADFKNEKMSVLYVSAINEISIKSEVCELGKRQGEISKSDIYVSDEHDIAYYLYTSGSTGNPKAVEITQKNLRNFINAMNNKFAFEYGQSIACITSMSFDIFFLESIYALVSGLSVVLASESERENPKQLMNLLKKNHVDILQITPSHLGMLHYLDSKFDFLNSLKFLLVGGEAFPSNLLKELQERTTCRIFNMYGPTETTIWSSVAELTSSSEVDIGTPIVNTEFYIFNDDMELIKNSGCGELYIAGDGVANGYKNNELLTKEKFINMFVDKDIRSYRTGDLVKLENGKYYCLGRKDNQVKFRGHRIELEEIDFNCNKVEGINRCITYLCEGENESHLVTLYEGKVEKDSIRKKMELQLPDYMVPSAFINVNKLYITSNGKIDRQKNKKEILDKRVKYEFISNVNEYSDEEKVINLIKNNCVEIIENVQLDTDLSSFAFDSLSFIQLVVEIEEIFEIEFEEEMLNLDKFETINEMLTYIKALQRGEKIYG